jgi:predicted nuclease of predicted toxin-antitoxin system
LSDLGHDVVSAVNIDPHADDAVLLDLAVADERVLVTADKDFGELVFVWQLPHHGIVRFVEMSVRDQVAATRELLQSHQDDLAANSIIVVTPGRVRVRRPPPQ